MQTKSFAVVFTLLCLSYVVSSFGIEHRRTAPHSPRRDFKLHANVLETFFSGGNSIPSSLSARDNQAISAIKAAISKPKVKDFPLIECEFPPLGSLNKLGDGSMRSSNQVDDANIAFCTKLIKSIGGILGPKTWFITSATASMNLSQKAQKATSSVHSFRDGIPPVSKSDFCVVLAPCVQSDYENAKRLAKLCKAVILVNGFAKDTKSVPETATMAYFLKPLTYNSQIVGYLQRCYPSDWVTMDATTKKTLQSFSDGQILVPKTNTPDLREPGRLVQRAVDQRAIEARNKQ